MFFDKVSLRIPNYSWVKFFIDNNLYIDVENLIVNDTFYKYSDLITYPIAGAFVEYLILMFGIDKFKEFYSSLKDNFEKTFSDTFNISIYKTNEKFKNYINSIGNNVYISNMIKDELVKRKLFK